MKRKDRFNINNRNEENLKDVGDKQPLYVVNKPKKKKFSMGKLLVTVLISCNLILAGNLVSMRWNQFQDINSAAFQEENLDDYLMKTDMGAFMKLPVDENPIAVVLGNLNEDEKKSVVGAINTLDNISTNIDYTILEKDDLTIKNKIYITNGDVPDGALGMTTVDSKRFTGEIQYPIHINIDMDACHRMFSDITGEDAVGAVTKHELAHTLGFKDLYESKYMKESIMYYSVYQESYTESDERRIRAYYGGVAEDASGNYNYDFSIDENAPQENLPTNLMGPISSEEFERQMVALRKVRSNPIAEVWEPAEMIYFFENDKSKTKGDRNSARDSVKNIAKKEDEIDNEFGM